MSTNPPNEARSLVLNADSLPDASRSGMSDIFEQQVVGNCRHDKVHGHRVGMFELPILLGSSIEHSNFRGSRSIGERFRLWGRDGRVVYDMTQPLRSDQRLDTSLPDDPVRPIGSKFRERGLIIGKRDGQHPRAYHL